MPRKLLGLAGIAGAGVAAFAFLRRGTARRRERVDLYFADGSMVSLADGSPEGDRMLALGRTALHAAR